MLCNSSSRNETEGACGTRNKEIKVCSTHGGHLGKERIRRLQGATRHLTADRAEKMVLFSVIRIAPLRSALAEFQALTAMMSTRDMHESHRS